MYRGHYSDLVFSTYQVRQREKGLELCFAVPRLSLSQVASLTLCKQKPIVQRSAHRRPRGMKHNLHSPTCKSQRRKQTTKSTLTSFPSLRVRSHTSSNPFPFLAPPFQISSRPLRQLNRYNPLTYFPLLHLESLPILLPAQLGYVPRSDRPFSPNSLILHSFQLCLFFLTQPIRTTLQRTLFTREW